MKALKKYLAWANYYLNKTNLTKKTLYRSRFKKLQIVKCNSGAEWDKAKYLRQKYFFDTIPISDPYTWTFNHQDHEHLVLYQGTEIIGYAHIQFWKDHRSALRIIVIDETKRNLGLGTLFLKTIENWLKTLRVRSLHIESSAEALDFYKRQGYNNMPFYDPDGYKSDPRDIAIGKDILNEIL